VGETFKGIFILPLELSMNLLKYSIFNELFAIDFELFTTEFELDFELFTIEF
jgi:hypothetical protein